MSLQIFNDKDINSEAAMARRQDFLARMERKLEFKTSLQDAMGR